MSARAKQTTFLREAGFGLVLSLAVGALGFTLTLVIPPVSAIRIAVAGIGLVFVLRTLARSGEPTGRVTVVLLWTAAALGVWLLDAGLGVYVAIHAGLIWLVRSLYAYSRLTEAALDLALSTFAVSFAVWALVRTDSVFLAVWCFALGQAMHVAIPALAGRLLRPRPGESATSDANRGFAEALGAADEALHRIAARR